MINKGIDDESLPPARLVFAYRRLQPHYEFTRRKRVETFKGWSLASTFKSNRSVIKLLRELTFRRDRAIASRNRALFPPTLPFPAVRVSRNKISSCCLLSPLSLSHTRTHLLSLSLLLALVSRGKHELERNERHSSEKLRFQGATGNLCCFYPRLANRFSRFRVSLVRKANFIDAIEGSGGMGDRNWRIVIGYRKRRHGE